MARSGCFVFLFTHFHLFYSYLTVKLFVLTGCSLHSVSFLYLVCVVKDLLFVVFSECEDNMVLGCCCDSDLYQKVSLPYFPDY